ncbi:putative spermidine/putrescine transport system substrate-binding protein [Palleronia aestuarii]|uniref:Putative spermidine/putrescine transport system substrate-binding protein n=1 Tax=Palleronia aestuarii TaxID=568105 RepID=A0A2W7NQA9_9RHOB|nr:extracellular solute-binding protein [Palleronia aestuarii]PZX13472.1 putative spermidine/putrescine transport system substrate-binding protein [Palleronia aestuarii]
MSQRSRIPTNRTVSRRTLLRGAAGLAGAGTAASLYPMPLLAQERRLAIGSYGGYFENSFMEHVYPAFTEATGIAVDSVTQPNSADWLVTLQQAQAAGSVPADLSLFARDTMIRASRIGGLLAPLDMSAIPAADNLDPYFVFSDGGDTLGVGAMSWFVSMVVNPDAVEVPQSWAEFWDTERFEASLGLSRLYNSMFLDIVAATFFDGAETMGSREGIVAVVEKAGEIKPNVALWYSAESQMEQAMKNLDVIGGQYYHDVAQLMAADGFPIRSIFPKEGNVQDYGSWCLSPLSEKGAEAAEFIDFSSQPETQALMSRMIGTAPLVPREATDLTQEEFDAVSGSPAIRPAYEAYLDEDTFIKETWDKMLAGA